MFPGASVSFSPAVAAARTLIDNRDAEPLTYRIIGREVGRDPEHLERRFSAECGVTLHAYLRDVRLRRAYALARSGQKIESLPGTVGFRSKGGFFRAFRSMFGCTPGAIASTSGS